MAIADIAPTCFACGNSIYSAEHQKQREKCSRIKKQQSEKMKRRNAAKKEVVITPYLSKLYSNGSLSRTEFY